LWIAIRPWSMVWRSAATSATAPVPSITYIIGLGARAAKADALSAFKAGADDYLTKPIEGSELLHRVRTGLRVLEKEEKLSRIIRGWRTMLDSLPFGVACLGHGGRLLRANMIFVSLLGYRVESLLGKSLKQTVLSDPTQFSNLMIQVRMGTPFDRVEMDMMHHDRTIRTLLVWGRPIPDTPDMVYQIITSLP
jgi:PAS domain S-box-containing protein